MRRILKLLVLVVIFGQCYAPALAFDTPNFQWVKNFDNAYNGITDIDFDSSGNLYYVGNFVGTDTNLNPDGTDLKTSNGSRDVLFTKYNSDGTYAWTKTWGGTGAETAYSFDIDSTDNVYIFGNFQGSNVNFNPGGTDLKTSNGGYDNFLTKYNSNGTYAWTKTWGGTGAENAYSIRIDSNNNIYLVGRFQGSNVNFNPDGTDLKSSNGDYDAFFTKFNSDGSYAWTKTWGSTLEDASNGLAFDSNNNIFLVGRFHGTNTNFNPDGTDLKTSNGDWDAYLTKYNANGTYAWTKTWGGAEYENSYSVQFDSNNNLYVVGSFSGTGVNLNPDGSNLFNSNSGSTDVFLIKFNSEMSYNWTKTWGGPGYDDVYWQGVLHIDSNDNIYVTGNFEDAVDFDPGIGTAIQTAQTAGTWTNNVYVLSLDTNGSFQWVKSFGAVDQYDDINGAFSRGNDLYVFGAIGGFTDFNPGGTPATFNTAYYAGYLVKYSFPTAAASDESSAPRRYQINQQDVPEWGGVVGPGEDSSFGFRGVTSTIEPYTFSFNAYLSVMMREPKALVEAKQILFGLDAPVSNTLFAGPIMAVKQNGRVYWQIGDLEEIWYKAYPPQGTDLPSVNIIPSLQDKPSIISLSYTEANLIPPGSPNRPFQAANLKLAYSEDGLTWKLLDSVVDPVNRTVSAVQKIGGYYVIVAGY